jgi:hypothetical protein
MVTGKRLIQISRLVAAAISQYPFTKQKSIIIALHAVFTLGVILGEDHT